MNVQERELQEKSSALIESKLKRIKKAALAAALVPLAVAAMSGGVNADPSSRVKSAVTQEGDKYIYKFTVINTSDAGASGNASGTGPGQPWIVYWMVPLFDKNDVANVKSPEGWAYEIVATDATTEFYNNEKGPYGKYAWSWAADKDPFLKKSDNAGAYGNAQDVFQKPPYIIHWYSTAKVDDKGRNIPLKPIGALDSKSGFEFTSAYGPANAPYSANWYSPPSKLGATALMGKSEVPNSPSFQKGIMPQQAASAQ